ncbi:MAG: LpxL/LpxP family Kdo(2)-lipid IV(A) lauroyl/palmitoleoyl acyltransferase [Porticoccaceae bacterium]|nr:LpxL/LpxP family Kdo(2)-lipid IV(A) lauroyl/palmitoleoyl acyltransferase [Porticoccaceae bacterium]
MEARPHFTLSLLHPRYWLTWLWLTLWRLLVLLLPYRVQLIVGRGLGTLLARAVPRRRKIAARNLELCFPELSDKQRAQLLRKHFHSVGIATFETGIAWWWPNWRFQRLLHFHGLEHFDRLGGRGALLMALHFTNLEVGASAISTRVCMDGMYRPNNNPVFDYVQRRGRERRVEGGRVYPRRDIRGVLKALKDGRILWYAPDQDYGPQQSIFAPLFGQQAATVMATGRLAAKSGAAVVPFTHYRRDDGKGYDIRIYAPLDNFPSGDDLADASHINSLVEHYIRQCPEQYLWVHRRFKTRPEGEASLYS